jgi:nitrogen-specific signal transduction histidine kinase
VAQKVAHEINNPLATLRNYIHILNNKSKNGETIANELAIIDSELERIGDLTMRLENLSDEQVATHFEEVDLHKHLNDIIALCQGSLPIDNEITLRYIPGKPPC